VLLITIMSVIVIIIYILISVGEFGQGCGLRGSRFTHSTGSGRRPWPGARTGGQAKMAQRAIWACYFLKIVVHLNAVLLLQEDCIDSYQIQVAKNTCYVRYNKVTFRWAVAGQDVATSVSRSGVEISAL